MKTCFVSILLLIAVIFSGCATHTEEMPSHVEKLVETAISDAEANTSKLWYLGSLAPPLCMATGIWTGLFIGHDIDSAAGWEDSAVGWGAFSDSEVCGMFAGATIGCFTPLILTYIYTEINKPVPNPEALLGKYPEFVVIYAEAYQKRSNFLKRKPVIAGTAAGMCWTFYIMVK